MKKFLHLCTGISLVVSSVALLLFSVQPAYGERESRVVSLNDPSLHVAYINIDTLNNNYKAYLELEQAAGDSLDFKLEQYQKKASELETRYARLQDRVNRGLISVEAAALEEETISKGMNALSMQETEIAYLQERAMAANDSISADVAAYMNDYAKKNNIDYVFMYGAGMPIIYANDALDITQTTLNALNAQYDASHKKSGK